MPSGITGPLPSNRRFRRFVAIPAAVMVVAAVGAWWLVVQPVLGPGQTRTSTAIDPSRLASHVRTLAEVFAPRDWRHADNLDRTATYIHQEFESAGARVHEQVYEMEGRTYRNVIARFGPDTGDVVVVGAHYDAAGAFPGADDNASGVAGLIEVGRAIGTVAPGAAVELAAFALEEPTTPDGPGLFRSRYGGSAVHVRSLRARNARVRVFINLEMIGFFSDERGSQRFPVPVMGWFYPDRGTFITVVGTFGQGRTVRRVKAAMQSASTLPVRSISAPASLTGIDWSDHANYWNAGYEAVMITDTSFYRNPNYHTAADTPETLDYGRMADVVSGVVSAVHEFLRD